MKRQKRMRLINEVLDARDIRQSPVQVSVVSIDFSTRTVTRDGRTVQLPDGIHAFTFPIVEGARLVIPKDRTSVL